MAPPGLNRHIALVGFMGAGKTTVGEEVAQRLDLAFVDTDREVERLTGSTIAELFADEPAFRRLEAQVIASEVMRRRPAVLSLGGGALGSEETRRLLREHAFTVLLEVGVDEAWSRVSGSDRPLAQDESRFRSLHAERAPLYTAAAEAVANDADGVILEAGAVLVEGGSLARLGEFVDGPSALVTEPRVAALHGAAARAALGEFVDGPSALVTEPRVAALHGAAARAALGDRLAEEHQLPTGESAKQLAEAERLWRALRLGRDGTLVALGGGTVTDAGGYAAAAYLRGIAWLAVPTTLTGQVDAGIGGKTGVDLREGKNLVGAFHWPARTVIDPSLLDTLPEEVRADGMAEVVKTGLLAGEPLWELEQGELVRRCAAYKTAICLRDPEDRGPRAHLNLGHTFAHALETASDYRLTHGRAVALGLLAALRLSGLDTEAVEETLAPQPVVVDRERAWQALHRDKKGGKFVLLEAPGRPVVTDVAERDARRALDELIV